MANEEKKDSKKADDRLLNPPVIIEYNKKEKLNRFNRKKQAKNSAGQRSYRSMHVNSQAGLDELKQNPAGLGVSNYRQQYAFSAKEQSLLVAT